MSRDFIQFLLAWVVFFGVIGAAFYLSTTKAPAKEIHIHAGFQVYKDDKLVNFAKPEFMEDKPCSTVANQKKLSYEEAQRHKAHLHELVGDVVHVHTEGATWWDLFKNLDYPLPRKDIVVYSNGERIHDFFNREIKPFERLVIFVGEYGNLKQKLQTAVTREKIDEIGKASELCGSTSHDDHTHTSSLLRIVSLTQDHTAYISS
jgi:hypothetical protein